MTQVRCGIELCELRLYCVRMDLDAADLCHSRNQRSGKAGGQHKTNRQQGRLKHLPDGFIPSLFTIDLSHCRRTDTLRIDLAPSGHKSMRRSA